MLLRFHIHNSTLLTNLYSSHDEKKTAAKSEAALGKVKGPASGGQKLGAETVSAETLDFLKNYQN